MCKHHISFMTQIKHFLLGQIKILRLMAPTVLRDNFLDLKQLTALLLHPEGSLRWMLLESSCLLTPSWFCLCVVGMS